MTATRLEIAKKLAQETLNIYDELGINLSIDKKAEKMIDLIKFFYANFKG